MSETRVLAGALIEKLRQQGKTIATAESCSGGLLAAALTDIPGASEVFGFGLITYSNAAKQRLLGVAAATLARYGAVSPETAQAMAAGLLRQSGADLAIGVTGIAGPGGGSLEKPVGLVYIGLAGPGGVRAVRCQFAGDRQAVRQQTVAQGLALALAALDGKEQD